MPNPPTKISLKTLRQMAQRSEPFACLTCYDATTAKWLEKSGVHVLLVGDTAAEVILGFDRTIDMPVDILLALTAAVKRGAPNTVVMADMPFMSYHAGEHEALTNAGRFLTEGHADIVKVEVTKDFAPLVAKMVRAGIPICAHVGSRPQTSALTSGYTGAGRTPEAAQSILEDAIAMEAAGATLLLAEAIPEDLTQRILAATKIPTIGIGAGNAPHGQVLVLQDLLGLSEKPPIFAPALANFGEALTLAGQEWVKRVRDRNIKPDTKSIQEVAIRPQIHTQA